MSGNSRKKPPSDIRLVAFDIDGVFTDGRFYLSDDGFETKAFHTQDGFGIRKLLRAGIQVAVISGRNSQAVELRMAELEVANGVPFWMPFDNAVGYFIDLLPSLPFRT